MTTKHFLSIDEQDKINATTRNSDQSILVGLHKCFVGWDYIVMTPETAQQFAEHILSLVNTTHK